MSSSFTHMYYCPAPLISTFIVECDHRSRRLANDIIFDTTPESCPAIQCFFFPHWHCSDCFDLGSTLRNHYERILYPFDVFKQGEILSEMKEESASDSEPSSSDGKKRGEKAYKPHGIVSRQAIKPPEEKYARRSTRCYEKQQTKGEAPFVICSICSPSIFCWNCRLGTGNSLMWCGLDFHLHLLVFIWTVKANSDD